MGQARRAGGQHEKRAGEPKVTHEGLKAGAGCIPFANFSQTTIEYAYNWNRFVSVLPGAPNGAPVQVMT